MKDGRFPQTIWIFETALTLSSSAVHLAEELQDAKYVLPRAMITGCVMNYAMGLVGLISFLFNVGTIDDSLYRYGGQPWVAVVYRITGSRAATIVLILVIAVNVRRSLPLCVLIAHANKTV